MSELRSIGFLKLSDDGNLVRQDWADEEQLAEFLSRSTGSTTIMAHDVEGRESTLALKKATDHAKKFVKGIFESWARLRIILGKHASIVRKRWLKKTTEQRKKVILATWPGMSERHRPDIFNMARVDTAELSGEMAKGTKIRVSKDDCYYPYISLEDLVTPRLFLVLLDARTRTTPDTFANADMNSIRVGVRYGTIKPEYLKGYTMHLVGEKTPETYGRMTCWRGNKESALAWVTGLGTQPGDGLIILEIQCRILKFLLACTELLLHDLALDDIDSAGSLNYLSLDLDDYSNIGQTSRLEQLVEAPHRVPDQFDFTRLHDYVNAERGEAEDHLWLLREDPRYFSEALREGCDHHDDVMYATKGLPIPQTEGVELWEDVIISLLQSVYQDVMLWNVVWEALQGLEAQRQHHLSAMLPGQRLPKEYKVALSHFVNVVEEMVKTTTEASKRAIMGCRPFYEHFILSNRDANGRYDVNLRKDPTDSLWWLVYQLQLPGDLDTIGLPSLLREVERLVAADSKQRNRLSPRLAKVISDFSILAEMQRQLGLSSPGGRIASAVPLKDLRRMYTRSTAPTRSVWKTMGIIENVGHFGLGMFSLEYPANKRRTAATTAQMRNAEQQLDKFWERIDSHFIQHTGKSLHARAGILIELRNLVRTPEWVGPEQIQSSPDELMEAISPSLLLATLEERTERTISREASTPIKEKVKTRAAVETPSALPLPLPQASTDDISTVPTTAAKFKLKKRSHRVISTLFHIRQEEGAPGELPWIEFLHAMTSLGFAV